MAVAEWFRRMSVEHPTWVRFPPVNPICLLGGSSIGRAVDFGSTGSRFDSEPPRHSGIDQLADRLALTQQVPGSIPGPGAILLCGRRSTGQDTALRTQRREGSNPSARTIFGLSLNWTGHIPPKDAIRVRIPAGRPGWARYRCGCSSRCVDSLTPICAVETDW